MVTMSVVRPPTLQHGDLIIREGPFTVAERDALPEDGYRHELLDGVLVMSPAPSRRHQDVAARVWRLLSDAAPRECKVMIAPFGVRLGPRTNLEPDVLVARRADVGPERLETAPLLAVEVASPSTRTFDLGPKKELLAAAGCPSYWTIEPEKGPELTAWELVEGEYVVRARVAGTESWTAEDPFPVTVVPVELLDD
jgi:Uma2 family endonuclease